MPHEPSDLLRLSGDQAQRPALAWEWGGCAGGRIRERRLPSLCEDPLYQSKDRQADGRRRPIAPIPSGFNAQCGQRGLRAPAARPYPCSLYFIESQSRTWRASPSVSPVANPIWVVAGPRTFRSQTIQLSRSAPFRTMKRGALPSVISLSPAALDTCDRQFVRRQPQSLRSAYGPQARKRPHQCDR